MIPWFRKSGESRPFSGMLFGKLVLGLGAAAAVFFLTFGNVSRFSIRASSPFSQNRSLEKRARALVEAISHDCISPLMSDLSALSVVLEEKRKQANETLGQWLMTKDDVMAVSVWYKDQKWPVRRIHDSFWSKTDFQKIPDSSRQKIFAYLFQDDSIVKKPMGSWNWGSVLPADPLDFTMVSLGFFPEDPSVSIRMVETRLTLKGLAQFLFKTSAPNERLAVLDSTGLVLCTSPDSASGIDPFSGNASAPKSRTMSSDGFRIPQTPWKLSLSRTEVPSRGRIPEPTIQTLWRAGIVGLAVLILAFLLTLWIDNPVHALVQSAAAVARGNFVEPISTSRAKSLNRLVKIFNYMAEEMGRLQNMDVSMIINEKNKTETILRNIADGVIVTDPEDRILVINQVAEKWFGLQEATDVQKPIKECIKNNALIQLLQEVKNGKTHSSLEFGVRRFGEREKTFQAHAARVNNPEGQLIGVVTVIRDITKEKEADRIKTELVSMVAHELKSPLTTIYGFSELLLESNFQDPQSTEWARIILNESSRLSDLINKFLDLSRLEAGRTEIKKVPFGMQELIVRVVETIRGQAEKKDIRISTNLPDSLPKTLGDPDMIEQVLLNLLSNAIKYSPKRSKIGVENKFTGKELEISVIDNGYGIPKEHLPRIFEKFYRVEQADAPEAVEGSGLGLALSREIVEQHGGMIKVSSKLGIGSVFTFTIPVVGNP